MKKILFFSFITLFFTSCFEIVEEINMKSNGAGQMLVTVNMSESKEDLKGYMDSGEVNGLSLPNQKELNSYLIQIEQTIESVEGMSNAKAQADFNEFIFTFAADFTSVKSMNLAINKLTKELSRGMISIDNKYEYANGQFKRSFGQMVSPEEYEKLPMMQRFVLESARMVSIYTFSKPVRKVANQNVELSNDKKVVKFESTLGDIAKGALQNETTITF